jgi:hypothetical protein
MKTLQECKDEVAKKAGFEGRDSIRPHYEGRYFDEVAEMYAQQYKHLADEYSQALDRQIGEFDDLETKYKTIKVLLESERKLTLDWKGHAEEVKKDNERLAEIEDCNKQSLINSRRLAN